MDRSRLAIAFGVIAAVAWAGELIFFYANARAFGSALQSLWWTTSFLTDWTGLLVAVVCTSVALNRRALSTPYWLALATVATVLVGTMFGLMGGWARLASHGVQSLLSFSSLLAHVVAPWCMLLGWLFAASHGGLRWRDAPLFMLFPLAYLVQMFARGALGGGYPYPEVDAGRIGWGPALTFASAVTLLFFVLGLLLVGLDRLLAKRRER